MTKSLLVRVNWLALAVGLLGVNAALASTSWDGSIELEQRYFFDNDAPGSGTDRGQTSARLQMEFYKDWADGDQSLIFEPFARIDGQDDERSHVDVRQLIWSRLAQDWELSVGIGRVFWGVTESQHLVDIVNQTDFVENIDGEDKLGQPMVRFQSFNDWGNLDAFVLPYFRPRTFAGVDSRVNGGIVVAPNTEFYESDDEESHIDLALRYSNSFGLFDVGLSVFDGTSREADLRRFFDPQTLTTTAFYPQITQYGADVQLTTGAWLFKLEAIKRDFDDQVYDDFFAGTFGFEYTLVGFLGSIFDLGMLAEYSWDDRDELATGPFQNDLFIGARLAFNDMNSSELLFGVVSDLDDSSSRSVFVEANTRLASTLTANIELRHVDTDNPRDPLFGFRDDSFVQIGLEYFFD